MALLVDEAMGYPFMLWIIITVIVGVAKWLVYTALLWLMIKIQKMQFNWLGLLGSSAAATALGYIPVVGPYVGWAVLVLCLWKVTHADIAPDVLFTVSIAGALMFCVNLFVIGALMGDLALGRFSPEDADAEGDDIEMLAAAGGDDDDADVESEADASVPAIKAMATPATNPPAKVAPAAVAGSESKSPPDGKRPISDSSALPAKLHLKGLAVTSAQRTAMIADGKEIHTIGVGDLFSVTSAKGALVLRCEEITAREVIVAANDGGRFRLTFQ